MIESSSLERTAEPSSLAHIKEEKKINNIIKII